MPSTFETLREIISDLCDVPAENIRPGVHLLQELDIDSVDFLDVVHEINRRYEISVPVADWVNAVNRGESDARYFVIDRLIENIDALAAQGAKARAASDG
jgi:acyl carrier protein